MSVNLDGWTSVEEGVPSEGEYCVCRVREGDSHFVEEFRATFENGKFIRLDGVVIMPEKWRLLPYGDW